jgi:hypothetical protein
VDLWRQVLEQKGEGVVDRSGINDVVVVEDEDEIVRGGGDFVEQGRQDRLGRRRLRGLERTQHPFPDIRRDRLQSGDEVSQEACGVVISLIKRQPGGRLRAAGEPFAEERGFAEACGGGDEGQPAVQTLVEVLDQAGAEDDSGPRWGSIEFSG